jgi:hypothetical protein
MAESLLFKMCMAGQMVRLIGLGCLG